MPSEQNRFGGTNFVRVPQRDIEGYGNDEVERGHQDQQLSGRERFRNIVQQVLRHDPSPAPYKASRLDADSSPASSDSTLMVENYPSLPIQQFDEADLTNGRYAEVIGYYGPEVVENNGSTSSINGATVDEGLEVSVESHPLALSPDGLNVDDRVQQNYSYRGLERRIEKPRPAGPYIYNYKPVPLRWQFILIAFGGLVIFFALSELALHLLPNTSDIKDTLPIPFNISEIRKKSVLYDDVAAHIEPFITLRDDTGIGSSTGFEPVAEVEAVTIVHPTNVTGGFTGVSSNTEPNSHIKSSSTAQPSTTEPSAIATQSENEQTPTTQGATEVTSPETSSSKATTTHDTDYHDHPPTSIDQSQPSTTEQATTSPTRYTSTSYGPTSSTHVGSEGTFTQNPSGFPGSTSSQYTTTLPQTTATSPLDTATRPQATTTLPPESTTVPHLTITPPQGTSLPEDTTTRASHTVSSPEVTILPPPDTTALPSHTVTMTEDPTTFITGFPSNITSSEELPPHPTMTTPLPGSDVESASLSTGSDTTSSSSLSKPASTESSQSINSSVPTKVTHTPLPSDTTDSTSQQAGPTISNTTSTIVGTDKATSGTETYTIISNTTTPATTHATTQTASQTVSSSDLTQLPPHSNSTSVEYTTPFTNLTKTEDTKTLSPPKTTTLISSSSISKSSYVEVTATSTIPDIKAADPLTDFTRVTTYGNDTVSTISQKVYDVMATSVQFDTSGKPIKTQFVHVIQSAQVTTLRNPLGTPTATVDYYPIESTTTLYDANSTATATLTTTIPKTGEWTTYYDGNDRPFTTVMLLRPIATDGLVGTPTPTITPLARVLEINPLPDAMYVAGHMIPTLLAILVSIPIRILNRTVKMYQGFHVLASEQGASGIDSLYLATTGPASLLSGLRSLRIGHYLLGLTNLLVIFSALTIPFSTEAFKPILKGPRCHDGNKIIQCSVLLGVSLEPAQMLAALLIALLAGIIMVAALLRRWKTGVDRDPWNIADMAQLAAGTDMRKYLERLRRYKSDSVDKMRANMFGLREWEENGTIKYSVLILNQEADDIVQKPVNKVGRSVAFVDSKNVGRQHHRRRLSGDSSPFYMLSSAGRIMLLFLLNAVLAAVIAYAIVAQRSEHLGWQSENAIGARFLFSGAGVLVTYVWGSLFNTVALLSPYKLLNRRRLNKGRAIHINPATNPFTGLRLAFASSRRDLYLGVVAATAILSEFLPLFLGNIPHPGLRYQSLEHYFVYLSVAILSIMILTVGSSFFVNRPLKLGFDPTTIGGAMYAAHVLSVEQPLKRFFRKGASNIV